VVAGFLTFCLPLFAHPAGRPDVFSALNSSLPRFPSLTLSDRSPFSFPSTFNWIQAITPDFLPALSKTQVQTASVSATSPKDSSKEVVDVHRSNLFDYAGGEVGVMYGRSTGKFGREFEAGYFVGEVGNDKLHISAGASYENSTRRR
jgi:hypothetical protein